MILARHYKTKTIILFAIFLLVLAAALKTQLDILPQKVINSTEFRVLSTPYSIDFFSNNTEEKLFKISPYDDYIYFGNRKDHVYNKPEYRMEKDYFSEILNFLLQSKNLTWKLRTERTGMTYTVKASDNEVNILRNFKADTMPTSIGQSIVFCFDCLVSDEYNKIYFNSDQLTKEKLFLAQKLKLIPLLISKDQFFPKGVYRIKIISRLGRPRFEIYVNDYQEIYYDEKYHLIELKTYIDKAKPAFVSQKIAF